ncbi:uncharacterized protein LOC111049560 isoform X1 [Nilaparvata lugens]|uniref:uncharacterized protein LOC111049560 isoform X1 n=1 Tax=Nilaparvata lugens TaxID=108931 RepID=UPI00193CEDA0|nr:uncharacterized protein LOC111049560 isoform X1 [Nilaparvata lugens]
MDNDTVEVEQTPECSDARSPIEQDGEDGQQCTGQFCQVFIKEEPHSYSAAEANMPRLYRRFLGRRNYRNYSEETLEMCMDDIRTGELSLRKASDKYNIPITTLKNKLKNRYQRKPGGKCIFNSNEEKSFVQHLMKLSEFGFPVTKSDLRMTVKAYLDKQGITIQKFKGNIPGYHWMKSFLERYPELSVRFNQNIIRLRAGITEKSIESYINHLHEELDGVPASNVWNYDETHFSDDPGNDRAIYKRGMKYLDRNCNHSKASTSVMFCGNAEGRLLPPYIVFKDDYIWSTWVNEVKNGPTGARYKRSKTGWFDATIFEDWFKSLFLPSTRHLEGPVVLIGDNSSSHINEEVLRLCSQENIKFICLPPNATHIAQPLDVAFFDHLKLAWRSVLSSWRDTAEGSKYSTIPKEKVPVLLKKLMMKIKVNKAQNLISGFRKCGIVPVDKNVLLAQLPNSDVKSDLIGTAFMTSLTEKRKEVVGSDGIRLKRKKINVSPGKSITVNDLQGQETSTSLAAMKIQRKNRRIIEDPSSSSSSDDYPDDISLESPDECLEKFSQDPDKDEENSGNRGNYKIGDYVIVLYSGRKYPGVITEMNNDGPTVDCLVMGNKYWYWPERKDIMEYPWDSIVKKIDAPKPVSIKRSKYFSVPELNIFI